MPRSKSLTLGIDLNDHEIRVVLVDASGGRPFVEAAVMAPLPTGVIAAGLIQDPAAVARVLRRLIEPLRLDPTIRAVVGISSVVASTRLLSLPPCEDREIPTLVEGELEHQGIPPSDDPQEIVIFPQQANGPSGAMRTVIVVSAEAGAIRTLRDAVEGAGLKVAAIETSQVAKLRTATLALPLSAATFFLVLGPSVTGVSYFYGPDLVASRRIEVGSSNLVRGAIPTHDPLASEGASTPLRIDHAAIDRLAIESLQMMEFVQRDYAQEIESVRIYAIEPELEVVAPMLERRFGLPTTFSSPPVELDDVRYSVAYGLAVRDFVGPFNVPKVDLYAKMRNQSDARETVRNLVGSLLASGLALAVGIVGSVCYGRLISALDKHTRQTSDLLAVVRTQNESTRNARAARDQLYTFLRHGGVPLGAVMDDVVGGIDGNVRLKSVGVGKDLSVRIHGEAQNEAALGRIAQRLQASSALSGVGLAQLDRSETPGSAPLTFEIDATTVAADRFETEGRP